MSKYIAKIARSYNYTYAWAKSHGFLVERINRNVDGIRYRYSVDDGNGMETDCENLVDVISEIYAQMPYRNAS